MTLSITFREFKPWHYQNNGSHGITVQFDPLPKAPRRKLLL
jgi:hypothetical protein